MRILVTGHDGYIGTRLTPLFMSAGHEVVGLDSCLFSGCTLGSELPAHLSPPAIRADVRDVTTEQLAGFDAVVHLAGISNDPLGELNPDTTIAINHRATVRLAEVAKEAGVPRFLFSSSCSLYGAQGDGLITEDADFKPVTAYGRSKIDAEQELSALADDSFSPTYLRNATAYGVSPRIRGDLVVNNLVGHALTTGKVFLKSDGTPWRPLVHIEDIARAFLVLAAAPREAVHNEAFNVGRTEENFQIRQVAEIVQTFVPGSEIAFSGDAGPDLRNYRVSFEKLEKAFPEYQPQWTLAMGVQEIVDAFRTANLTIDELEGAKYLRIQRVKELVSEGRLGLDLRWVEPQTEVAHG